MGGVLRRGDDTLLTGVSLAAPWIGSFNPKHEISSVPSTPGIDVRLLRQRCGGILGVPLKSHAAPRFCLYVV